MVGVVAHQRGKIKGGGETGLALREQITEALVGVRGGAESRELAHGPQASAMHGGMNAASVGRLAGEAKIACRIPLLQIGLSVETANGIAGYGREFFLAFRALPQRGLECVLFPGF